MSAQQVYAVIKARSKYTYQQPRDAKGVTVPFPVHFDAYQSGHCVFGNLNQYRIEDLNFFVLVGTDPTRDDSFVRIK